MYKLVKENVKLNICWWFLGKYCKFISILKETNGSKILGNYDWKTTTASLYVILGTKYSMYKHDFGLFGTKECDITFGELFLYKISVNPILM